MKRILGSIKKPKNERSLSGLRASTVPVPTGDGPEAIVYREVEAFCESNAPGSTTAGDEYLHLPAIVDAAESSPAAAHQAVVRIRGYLGKDHYDRGFAQYNAIMLTRILTDNPGRRFTQHFDKDFISTVKRLLREGKDTSVQQILRETLDYFEIKSTENDTLQPLMEMWRKEKGTGARIVYPRSSVNYGPASRAPARSPRLPPPGELAARIEEAKTTARLLVQTMQSTPANELPGNDLVKEFAERARVAQKSIQGYINAENPHPDDDTMLTLIETSEQLNVAMTKHQRSLLNARKAVGGTSPSPQPQDNIPNQYMTGGERVYGQNRLSSQPGSEQSRTLSPPLVNGQGRNSPRNEQFKAPPGPPPGRTANTTTVYSDYQTQPSTYLPSAAATERDLAENPFTDAAGYEAPPEPQNYSLFGRNPSQVSRQPTAPVNAYGQPAADNPYSAAPPSTQPSRPGAYNTNFTSTPSYMHRQESAAENITMHGASPPPQAQ